MEVLPEGTEEPDLRAVPDRLATGERAHRELEADRRVEPGEVVDRDALDQSALDPADLRRRKPDRTRHRGEAERPIHSGVANLPSGSVPQVPSARRPGVDRADARRHGRIIAEGPYRPITGSAG
jgi:hypothetical protein